MAKKHHKYGKLAYEASVENRRENLFFLPLWQGVAFCNACVFGLFSCAFHHCTLTVVLASSP